MKPWLQGRLALSKQTSRFELPMDVRLLEGMAVYLLTNILLKVSYFLATLRKHKSKYSQTSIC